MKNPGKPVLTDWRARRLGQAARKIEKLFKRKLSSPVPLDMEWLYEDKQLVVDLTKRFAVTADDEDDVKKQLEYYEP